MRISLSSLVPHADDLLALEVEEVAGVLLVILNSLVDDSGGALISAGRISQNTFFGELDRSPDYPLRKDEVKNLLIEAWSWLHGEGFLVRHPHHDWFMISTRAKRLQSRDDFAAYRKGSLLPKAQLHPMIAAKVYPAFLRGEYDTAVFQAFREVEISVRTAGKFPPELVGKELMRGLPTRQP